MDHLAVGIHFTRRGFAVELSVEKKSDGNEEKSPPTFFPFYLSLPLVNDGGKRQSSTFEPLLLSFSWPKFHLPRRGPDGERDREAGGGREGGAQERIVFGNGRGRPASALPPL